MMTQVSKLCCSAVEKKTKSLATQFDQITAISDRVHLEFTSRDDL